MKDKVILICNQKGGVGKTLIADELAFAFDRDKVPYNLYDLDQQGGSVHGEKEAPNAVVTIVDTPGALQEDMLKWMKEADLIIIPTRMSPRDMPPLETMIDMVSKNDISADVIFVFNGWNRYRATAEFEEWFKETYPKAKSIAISQSEAITQAALDGKSVVEYKPSSVPAQKIAELVKLVKKILKLK